MMTPKVRTDRERFDMKWELDPVTGCWEWTAWRHHSGYGVFYEGRKQRAAHRIGYQLYVGPIPEGLELDHLCRNRGCVNPEHLEPVTHRENTLRGESEPAKNARMTECPKGHKLQGDNLIRMKDGRRQCRICTGTRWRRNRRSRRASKNS